MFFGHEHTNTLSLRYQGIDLSYAVKTGNFSSYKEGNTGGTAITITGDGTIAYEQLYTAKMQ